MAPSNNFKWPQGVNGNWSFTVKKTRIIPFNMFEKKNLWRWILFFTTACIFVHIGQSCYGPIMDYAEYCSVPVSTMIDIESRELLRMNAGLFATMLIVGLSTILISLQFRAQTYSMNDMTEFINNKPTFVFLLIFICGATFSMLATMRIPLFPDPHIVTPYVVIGTFFSMWYYVGYVYQMIYRIDPLQMIKIIDANIDKSINNVISGSTTDPIFSRPGFIHTRSRDLYVVDAAPFDQWKAMMKKAIDLYDDDIFNAGMGTMMGLIPNKKILKNEKIYFTFFLKPYLVDVMEYCMEQNRRRLERRFVEMADFMLFEYGVPISSNDDLPEIKLQIKLVFKLVDQIMLKSVNNDDISMFKRILHQKMTEIHHGVDAKLISKSIVDVMSICISMNHGRMMRSFAKIMPADYILRDNFDEIQDKDILIQDMLNIWLQIIYKTIDTKNEVILTDSMNVMLGGLLERSEHLSGNFNEFMKKFIHNNMTEITNSYINNNDEWTMKIFLKNIIDPFFLMIINHTNSMDLEDEMWNMRKRITRTVIDNNLQKLIPQCMSILYDSNLQTYVNHKQHDFFLPFINSIKNHCYTSGNTYLLKTIKDLVKDTMFANDFD